MMLTLSKDTVRERIPYGLVCETREGARWNSSRRRRLWNALFTKQEQKACSRLFKTAYCWTLVKGVPETVRMTPKTLEMWDRLGVFCLSL